MNKGRTVFAQLIEYASHKEFQKCVRKCSDRHRPRRLSPWDQFLATGFAQLTYREKSLLDIELEQNVYALDASTTDLPV